MPATSVAEPAKVAPSPQPAPQPVPQPAQAAPATPVAPAQGKHVFQGYVSIIVAIIGFGLFFIPIPVADRFWVLLFVMFVEAIAVSAASKATERGDKLGTYAMIIAAIVIIIAVIGVFVM